MNDMPRTHSADQEASATTVSSSPAVHSSAGTPTGISVSSAAADVVKNPSSVDAASAVAVEPAVPPNSRAVARAQAQTPASNETIPGIPGIGVLLVNLGTPDAAEPKAVRRYLKEFLSDPRVIENDTLLWKLVLNGIILPLRPLRKARDYQKIWNHERNESPLKTITRSQAEKLASILEPLGKHVVVDWAMRYGNPSIASRLAAMAEKGCERILIVPLYPQYAAATTATVCDEAFRALMKMRRQPSLRVAPPYFDEI